MNTIILTQKELKRQLHYNPYSGEFTWIIDKNNKVKSGNKAGTLNADNYLVITINYKPSTGHRLAWLYMTGEWPENEIDHISHNKSDNRWDNLRQVTRYINMQNISLSSRNTSGVMGVSWDKTTNKWRSCICVKGKNIHLGRYDTLDSASKARKQAEIKYGFHKNHGNSP